MIEQWFKQEITNLITKAGRVVILDTEQRCEFLLSTLADSGYLIIKTDPTFTEEWQRVKEELFLRYEAETSHAGKQILFYVTRPLNDLSFLFDYSATHGCIDLSNPVEWIKNKLFQHTGLQIQMENPLLLTAAKIGVGKDIDWWKRILQNLDDPLNIEGELLPFLEAPATYMRSKDPDIAELFGERLSELTGTPYISKPPETISREIAHRVFNGLLYDDIPVILLKVYHSWTDSDRFRTSLEGYLETFTLPGDCNLWAVHPDHCFTELDKKALYHLSSNIRDTGFIKEKLPKIKRRITGKAGKYVPSWWKDVLALLEYNDEKLSKCSSFGEVVAFYTTIFHKVDNAMRHLYEHFIYEEGIIRPLQELYEIHNRELLAKWFAVSDTYSQNQQGYLVSLFKKAKPGVAVIVGDGIRYEIAAAIADRCRRKFAVETQIMLGDLPSETEHNMSALYAGNNEIIAVHDERKKRLLSLCGKDIQFIELEEVNQNVTADFLVLTYKDIDSVSEKMQHGALKLFDEFENALTDKITLLLNCGFEQVHLVTDHGFVLTGLLDEADKIEPTVSGKKEVHERFIRCENKQCAVDLIEIKQVYNNYNYLYFAKNHRPFKTKGAYGYSHGGFTPQEIVLPAFVFKKQPKNAPALKVIIVNKEELQSVTGNNFCVRLQAEDSALDLFATQRKVQVILFSDSVIVEKSTVVTIDAGKSSSMEFTLANKKMDIILIDSETQEQIDKVTVEKSNARDLGGLL